MVVIIVNHFPQKEKCFFALPPIFLAPRPRREAGSSRTAAVQARQERQKSHTGRSHGLSRVKNRAAPPAIPAAMYSRSSPSPTVMVK